MSTIRTINKAGDFFPNFFETLFLNTTLQETFGTHTPYTLRITKAYYTEYEHLVSDLNPFMNRRQSSSLM